MKLKLITYNIWHGKYLETAIEFLRQEKPDIVHIQEAGTTGQAFEANPTINIFENLQQALGYKGIYKRMYWSEGSKGRFDLGVATFSRWPIVETTAFNYEAPAESFVANPDHEALTPRILLGTKIKVETGEHWFFTTHFTITPEATVTSRQLQSADAVKDFLSRCEAYLFSGDMNTPYGTETYRKLAAGLEDVSLPQEPTLHPTIHAVGKNGYHVDYVFKKGNAVKVINTKIPVVDGSDHLPVVVTLEA